MSALTPGQWVIAGGRSTWYSSSTWVTKQLGTVFFFLRSSNLVSIEIHYQCYSLSPTTLVPLRKMASSVASSSKSPAMATIQLVRSQIFQTSHNPENIRTGAKYLKKRLRGPSMVGYITPSYWAEKEKARYVAAAIGEPMMKLKPGKDGQPQPKGGVIALPEGGIVSSTIIPPAVSARKADKKEIPTSTPLAALPSIIHLRSPAHLPTRAMYPPTSFTAPSRITELQHQLVMTYQKASSPSVSDPPEPTSAWSRATREKVPHRMARLHGWLTRTRRRGGKRLG
jgi:hypothetical protein